MRSAFTQTGLRFLWISVLVVLLDQWTKQLVLANIDLYQAIEITGFFNLTYVRNYGAAFSFLHDAGGWQRWFFTAIAAVVSVLILRWLKQSPREHVLLPVSFSLILGGALGNVYDRLIHGFVVDFIDVYYQQWHWPAFNLADSAICVGAVLLVWDMFRPEAQQNQEKAHD
ncbi:signal peptidase II [Aestuariibacter halophilus]|uniref:Lipoprotein signal peptidase n=1 Tax=Fluctibacter halophilus TaxID=226011 RepID=A0ABS8G3G6_9ALTE|nr:signal peptidase II [Aestuariibacter halophilus]MCC2614646.1 signal peptidase II [Aestuariibacter halophilus]